jgi:hypothetical protein
MGIKVVHSFPAQKLQSMKPKLSEYGPPHHIFIQILHLRFLIVCWISRLIFAESCSLWWHCTCTVNKSRWWVLHLEWHEKQLISNQNNHFKQINRKSVTYCLAFTDNACWSEWPTVLLSWGNISVMMDVLCVPSVLVCMHILEEYPVHCSGNLSLGTLFWN